MLRIVCFKTHPAITDAWTRAAAKFDLSWAKVDYFDVTDKGRQEFLESLKNSNYDFTMMVYDEHIFVDQLPSFICRPFTFSNDLLYIGTTTNKYNTWFGNTVDPQRQSGVIFRTSVLYELLSNYSDSKFKFKNDDAVLHYNRLYPSCVNSITSLLFVCSTESFYRFDEKFKSKQIRIDSWLYTDKKSMILDEYEWEFKK